MKKRILWIMIYIMTVVLFAHPCYALGALPEDPPPEEEPAPAESPAQEPVSIPVLPNAVTPDVDPGTIFGTPETLPENEIEPAAEQPATAPSGLAGAPQVPEAEAGEVSGYDGITILEDDLVAPQ